MTIGVMLPGPKDPAASFGSGKRDGNLPPGSTMLCARESRKIPHVRKGRERSTWRCALLPARRGMLAKGRGKKLGATPGPNEGYQLKLQKTLGPEPQWSEDPGLIRTGYGLIRRS